MYLISFCRANASPSSSSSLPKSSQAPTPDSPSSSISSPFSLPKISPSHQLTAAVSSSSSSSSSSSFALPTTPVSVCSSSHSSSSSEVSFPLPPLPSLPSLPPLPPTPSSTRDDDLDDILTIDPQSLIDQLLEADPLKPQRILVSSDSIKNVTDSLTEVRLRVRGF